MEVGERKNPIIIYDNWIIHDIMIKGYTYNELKNYGKKGLKMYEKIYCNSYNNIHAFTYIT